MCLKLSMAITGQSAGVFWMWRSGCLNLSQSAWRKFIVPLNCKQTKIHVKITFNDYLETLIIFIIITQVDIGKIQRAKPENRLK